MRIGAIVVMLAALPFVTTPLASAQTTADVSGTVTDSTGGVLPYAQITVANQDTGINRSSVADDQGRYRVTNLQIGTYNVTATMEGFQTTTRQGVSLTIGRNVVVDLVLNLGDLSENVTVTGATALVELSSGSLGTVVDRETILEIPLNGRDLTGLITLQAGVSQGSASGSSASNGWSNKFSIGGARPNDNAVLLDGTEVRSMDQGVPAGISGNFMGGEAIQEFKVEKNSYSAEFGGATGGTINVVSKSGSNAFHGSVYGFTRNDALDAVNYRAPTQVNSAGQTVKIKPDFWRYQYGASAGGRIIENKTFYFANFEGLREELGGSSTVRTLTAPARQGIFPNRVVPVNPAVVRYLDLWPLPGPSAVDLGDGTAREQVPSTTPTDEDFFQVRMDHNLSQNDSVFGRVTRQVSDRTTTQAINRWGVVEGTYSAFLTAEYKKIVNNGFLNTFRFGYNRRGLKSEAFEDPGVNPDLFMVPVANWLFPMGADPIMGTMSVTNLTGIGLGRGWVDRATNRYQFTDTVVLSRGSNTIKFGVDVMHMWMGGDNPSRPAGELSFSSIDNFLRGLPRQFRGDVLPTTDFTRNLYWNTIASFAQYDWHASSRLTLNLGLRHDFYTVPTEKDGKVANVKNPLTDTSINVLGTNGDSLWENPSLLNFSPRVGMSWDPTGSGKTAVRAGLGMFHNLLQPEIFRQSTYRTAPFALETNLQAVEGVIPFPAGRNLYDFIVALGQAQADVFVFPYFKDDVGNPRMLQWNVNVQRELGFNSAVTVGYAGSKGSDTTDRWAINTAIANLVNGRYVFPANAARPNPNFNLDLTSNTNTGDSWYHSLQVEGNRRFRGGWQVQLAYTYARALDLVSSAGPEAGMYYPDRMLNKGLAEFDARHRFTGSAVWQLPNAGEGMANAILGGWQLSGILTFSAGRPSSVTIGSQSALAALGLQGFRPDLIAGGNSDPILGGWDLYFDPSQFVLPPARTIGNVGRNTLIGPGLSTVDMGLTKNISFGDKRLQFRLEVFNLLNTANKGNPTTSVMTGNGAPNADAGFIASTSTTARQAQLGLRVDW